MFLIGVCDHKSLPRFEQRLVIKTSGLYHFLFIIMQNVLFGANKIKSITKSRRNYCGKHQRALPSCNLIPRWALNCQDRGTAEIRSRFGRLQWTSEMDTGYVAVLTDIWEHFYEKTEVVWVFLEIQFNEFSSTNFTCFRTNCVLYESLKNVIMKPALCLPLAAYKIMNRTHPFSIILFFQRMCLSRGW